MSTLKNQKLCLSPQGILVFLLSLSQGSFAVDRFWNLVLTMPEGSKKQYQLVTNTSMKRQAFLVLDGTSDVTSSFSDTRLQSFARDLGAEGLYDEVEDGVFAPISVYHEIQLEVADVQVFRSNNLKFRNTGLTTKYRIGTIRVKYTIEDSLGEDRLCIKKLEDLVRKEGKSLSPALFGRSQRNYTPVGFIAQVSQENLNTSYIVLASELEEALQNPRNFMPPAVYAVPSEHLWQIGSPNSLNLSLDSEVWNLNGLSEMAGPLVDYPVSDRNQGLSLIKNGLIKQGLLPKGSLKERICSVLESFGLRRKSKARPSSGN